MGKSTAVIPIFKTKRDVRSSGTIEVAYPAPQEFQRYEAGQKVEYVLGQTVTGQTGYFPKGTEQ